MAKQTTITVKGKGYTFYRNMRGMIDFERSKYTSEQMMEGDIETLLFFIYVNLRGACKREETEFDFDFESFVDDVDPEVIERFNELAEKHEPKEGEEKPGS